MEDHAATGHNPTDHRRYSPRIPFEPEEAEEVCRYLLAGQSMSTAAVSARLPYNRLTYWLRRGRQAEGPWEWRRFALRVAWIRQHLRTQYYQDTKSQLFPLEDNDLGEEPLTRTFPTITEFSDESDAMKFDATQAETACERIVQGDGLSQAAHHAAIPYYTMTYWLERGHEARAPLEWRRFALRADWCRAEFARMEHRRLQQLLFPDEQPELGSIPLDQ